MGLRDFTRELKESFITDEYEWIAKDSFTNPNLADEKVEKWSKKLKKGNKTADKIMGYLFGEQYYKPPFAEEWLKVIDDTEEEIEKAIEEYKTKAIEAGNIDSAAKAELYVKRYKNFLEWCDNEEVSEEVSINMLPICLDCGTVITAYHDKCPCCGRSFGDEEEESEVCYCSDCGAELDTGARFCQKCGKEIQLSTSFCSGCGTQLENDSRFCPNCGKEVR